MTAFMQADDGLIDDLKDRGNTLNNLKEVLPKAAIIEYYHEGSEEYTGIDWSSLVLVYDMSKIERFSLNNMNVFYFYLK